jgi:repressor LexA
MSTLTKRQKQIYDYIKKYIHKHGISPTFEEIKKHLHLKALSTISEHIDELIEKGFISKTGYGARSIEIADNKKNDLVQIPLLGIIAAGQPIEEIRQNEFIAVAKIKLPRGGNFYALQIKGDDMIDEDIKDGDIALIKQQKKLINRRRVASLIIDYEKRLKRFQEKQEKIKLKITNKLLTRKRCPFCNQKEDPDGRCKCVNEDAW